MGKIMTKVLANCSHVRVSSPVQDAESRLSSAGEEEGIASFVVSVCPLSFCPEAPAVSERFRRTAVIMSSVMFSADEMLRRAVKREHCASLQKLRE